MRNPENQDFLSGHTAAVLAERRGSGEGAAGNFRISNLENTEITNHSGSKKT
jgi:hypothetical protein